MNPKRQRMLRALRRQLDGFLELPVTYFPGPLGERLRYLYWKTRLGSLGSKVRFGLGIRIYSPENVRIGSNSWIDDGVIIIAGKGNVERRNTFRTEDPTNKVRDGDVVIGSQTHIACYVVLQGHGGLWVGNDLTISAGSKVYSLSHHFRDLTGQANPNIMMKSSGMSPAAEQAMICGPIVLEDGAWVGANSVILPGSHMGADSGLGALSLLKGQLPPRVIAAGNPARIIAHRDPAAT